MFESRNPATGELIDQFELLDETALAHKLDYADKCFSTWSSWRFEQRAKVFKTAAALLRERKSQYSRLISLEMGKLKAEADAEIDKCAKACDYYADNAAALLADQPVTTEALNSYVTYQPLGCILGIMPWNFPFWQVLRFLITTVMAGNVALVKHAPCVPQCALAIESLFADAGAPKGLVQTLFIDNAQVANIIGDSRVQGVSLTGSVNAGKQVALEAAKHLKKVVLELGGSDPFIVLADADIDKAAEIACKSRFSNAGQVCVAAKRFIVVDDIADQFVEAFVAKASRLVLGNPLNELSTLAPMAREDLRDNVSAQVMQCIAQGARILAGGGASQTGYFYEATILDHVTPDMLAFKEEIFGPVAAIVRVRDESEALALANQTEFGLGASVWTQDLAKGEHFARQLEAGVCFVNRLVGSDIRMPFGGVKSSGLGRELATEGIREFCNVKSIWIDG